VVTVYRLISQGTIEEKIWTLEDEIAALAVLFDDSHYYS